MDEKRNDVWFFEDVPVGVKTRSKYGRTIREADIVNFAGISGEYDPLSMDAEYAARSKYGGVVAQDMLLFTFTSSIEPVGELVSKMNQTILLARGQQNIKFLGKARVGDTIYTKTEILDKIDNRPNRGDVIIETAIMNQRGEVLQTSEYHVVVAKRCYFEQQTAK